MPIHPGSASPLRALVAEADRLMALRRFEEARALFARACAVERGNAELRVKLALAERSLGRFDAAEAEARRAVKLNPKSFLGHYALGLALHAQGDPKRAARAYQTAMSLEPRFPDLPYLLGMANHEMGLIAEAEAAYRRAVQLRPDFAAALSGLAAVLVPAGRLEEAEALLRRTLHLDPNAAEAAANLAALRVKAGAPDEALELYERAAALAPQRLDIRAQQAELLERQGRWDEAKAMLDAVPDAEREPTAALVRGRIARREGRLEDGLAALAPAAQAADRLVAGEAEIVMGQLLDSLNRPDEAFARLVSGNAKVAEAMGVDLRAPPPFLAEVSAARALLTPDLAGVAALDPPAGAPAAPVFLIGFPRSGTTLLEQALGGHPQIQAIEEQPLVDEMRGRFLALGTPLAAMTEVQAAELRAVYFAAADRRIARREGAVLLDKLPLNIVWAHLIWRVFPDARFILALRHPVDACLGCFMQHFAVNAAMSSFLSLEGAAQTYAAVMGLWRDIAASLPLRVHAVRYEDVVDDLAAQARGLLTFLDLPWDEAVLDTVAAARAKPVINTPSYHQVSQPIYRDAAFRWRRYQRHVEDAARTVQPFVELFGYA